jgi:sirohydrochlorin cobaltochelatase
VRQGILLFAHGSRDPEWAAPFRRIENMLSAKGIPVRLAFLEIMRPSLGEALADLEKTVDAVRIVPVFLGYGAHLREDLPALVTAAKPRATVSIDPPVGEQPAVLEAIAAAIASR